MPIFKLLGEKISEIRDNLFGDKILFNILEDIVYGLKDVNTENVQKNEIKEKYRDIFRKKTSSSFGEKYDKDEEIVAENVFSPRGLGEFLEKRGCCWIDFIGCDNFSDKGLKKQIFFASISQTNKIKSIREKFLLPYNLLIQDNPIDIFVQLFFANCDQFHNVNSKEILHTIQEYGFIVPFSRRFFKKVSLYYSHLRNCPAILNYDCLTDKDDSGNLNVYDDLTQASQMFIDDVKNGNKQGKFKTLNEEIDILINTIYANRNSSNTKFSELVNLVVKFNKSLYPDEVGLLYFIPVHCPEGTIGLFCYGSNKVLSENQLDDLKLLSYNILSPYVSAYKSAWEKELVVRESIKSAVSAIMSRNMSHNLGSHYMYYTKAYLEKIAMNEGSIAPDIRGAAKVLGYVQARMDYLATVISNDKYPYGPVNFKSQIYDELTVDDFSHRHFPNDVDKRTTNFLLTNLILSENFTRPDVRSNDKITDFGNQLFLKVKLSPDNQVFMNFTGTWHDTKESSTANIDNVHNTTMRSEEEVKNLLSSLNIALPGGSMSCHALFNIIENFIRNSAKYLRNEILSDQGLVCTIAILPSEENNNSIGNLEEVNSYSKEKFKNIVIYDNKQNACINRKEASGKSVTLFDQILDKLSTLQIIDENNRISKENKGFKEMLFSSIWLRAYNFDNKTYADVITEINKAKNGHEKLSAIERYGFTLVKVVEDKYGNIKSIHDRYNGEEFRNDTSLGIKIKLPIFNTCEELKLSGNKNKDINNMLNIMADVIEVDNAFLESEYRHVFTRTILSSEHLTTDKEKYLSALRKRFPDIDNYVLGFEHKDTNGKIKYIKEKKYSDYEQEAKQTGEYKYEEYKLYFKRHMNTQDDAVDYIELGYADTVSGGDFTVTLEDLFENGLNADGTYKSEADELFALKIKESALTRITLIDERLFNSTCREMYPWLKLKNVRVLNYVDDSTSSSQLNSTNSGINILDFIFEGSELHNSRKYTPNQTHFLTIHLGLIEKILKNSEIVNNEIDRRTKKQKYNGNRLSDERVTAFMEMLKEYFGGNNKEMLYIAIHSGRGNYSAELEGPLSRYPFISLSALENAYNNSKFQLSQLLYNTVYIGKGFINKRRTDS